MLWLHSNQYNYCVGWGTEFQAAVKPVNDKFNSKGSFGVAIDTTYTLPFAPFFIDVTSSSVKPNRATQPLCSHQPYGYWRIFSSSMCQPNCAAREVPSGVIRVIPAEAWLPNGNTSTLISATEISFLSLSNW